MQTQTELHSGAEFNDVTRVPRGWPGARAAALLWSKAATWTSSLLRGELGCYLIQGTERHGGGPMTLCYVGGGEGLEYLASVFFSDSKQNTASPSVRWWRIGPAIQRHGSDADLLVLDLDFPLHWFTRWFVGSAPVLSVPRWLKQSVVVRAQSWEDMWTNIRRKTRNEAKRFISKFDLKFDLVPGAAWGPEFYRTLYRPSVQKRFGSQGVIVDESLFVAECRKGVIARVSSDGRVLAAVLLHVANDTLVLKWFGSSTEELDANRVKGASDALDLETLRIAVERGLNELDMGHCRPQLDDGVLRYKQKWGAAIGRGKVPKGLFQIVAPKPSSACASALANNPFAILEHGRLVSRLWLSGGGATDHELEAVLRRYAVPGLSQLKVFTDNRFTGVDEQEAGALEVPTQFIPLRSTDDALRCFMQG